MKYLISHKGCTIIFDDKRRCRDCPKECGKDEVIQDYLKTLAKLVVAVNTYNHWIPFGEEIINVAKNLDKIDNRTKHSKDACEGT